MTAARHHESVVPGQPRTRVEQVADSRRRLLQATIELIAEQGYEATSAAQIGLRAGFSRAMVHARYGGKDALLDELMRTEYEERVTGDSAATLGGLDDVLAHVDRLEALRVEDERFLKAMFILSFEATRGAPTLAPRITRWLESLRADLLKALTAGQADGSVRRDVQVSHAAATILHTGFGIAYAWIVLPGTDLADELSRWRARIVADYSPPTNDR